MNLRQFAAQRPVLAALLCAGAQFLLTVLILKCGIAFAPPAAFGKIKLLAFASTVILPLLLVQVLGLWRQVGLEFGKIKPAPIFVVSLLSAGLFISLGVHAKEHASIVTDLLIQFPNAFGEELLFRGVIFVILLSLPRWQAILLGSAMFGSMHLIHGFMDASWSSAAYHAVATIPAGMMFTAVRYRTGSLWLAIILHMVLNLCIMYSNVELAAGPAAQVLVERLANAVELAIAAWVIVVPVRRPALA
jgi:membrane protease YdiL (CAAX protease family)